MQAEDLKKVKETADKKRFEDMSGAELQSKLGRGSRHEQGAAALELAARGLATGDDLKSMRALFGEDNPVVRQMENKMKSYNPVAVFTGLGGKLNEDRLRTFIKSNQFDAKKLGYQSLADRNLVKIIFQ